MFEERGDVADNDDEIGTLMVNLFMDYFMTLGQYPIELNTDIKEV